MKSLILLLLLTSYSLGQLRDSSTWLITTPAGKAVRLAQLALGDTNTRKTSGMIAYMNGSLYTSNGTYYTTMGGVADSSTYVTKATTQVISAPKYFTARNYHTSVALDTIDDKSGAGITFTGSVIGASSQNVFNTVSTAVNAFGAATTLTMGATTGTATVRNEQLNIGGASSGLQHFLRLYDGVGGSYFNILAGSQSTPHYGIVPSMSGTLALIDGGQTFTSAIWNATSIETTYTNAVSKLTAGYGITATKNAKDYKITVDSATLRSKFVPYSGANASVDLGAQTLTTTGSGSFGAITSTENIISMDGYARSDSNLSDIGTWRTTTYHSGLVASAFGNITTGTLATSSTATIGTNLTVTNGSTTLTRSGSSDILLLQRSDSAVGNNINQYFRSKNTSGSYVNYLSLRSLISENTAGIETGSMRFVLLDGGSAIAKAILDSATLTLASGVNLSMAGNTISSGAITSTGLSTFDSAYVKGNTRIGTATQYAERLTVQNGLLVNAASVKNSRNTTIYYIDSSGGEHIGGDATATAMVGIKNRLLLNAVAIQNSRGTNLFNIDSNGVFQGSTTTPSNYMRDSAAFTTTGTRVALYIPGVTKTDFYYTQLRGVAGSGTVYAAAVAADMIVTYAKTDSVIFVRAASGTSGQKFNYFRMK